MPKVLNGAVRIGTCRPTCRDRPSRDWTLGTIAPAASGTEYLADPNVFWLLKIMDLGMVIPALVVIGLRVLRRAAWASRAMDPASGWSALLGSSVAGMAVVMQAIGDPAGSTTNTVAFGTFALLALCLTVSVYRPLFGSRLNER